MFWELHGTFPIVTVAGLKFELEAIRIRGS
jgi:hypothetical protein